VRPVLFVLENHPYGVHPKFTETIKPNSKVLIREVKMNNKLRIVLMVVLALGISILAVTACGQSKQTSVTGKFTYLGSEYTNNPDFQEWTDDQGILHYRGLPEIYNTRPATSA